ASEADRHIHMLKCPCPHTVILLQTHSQSLKQTDRQTHTSTHLIAHRCLRPTHTHILPHTDTQPDTGKLIQTASSPCLYIHTNTSAYTRTHTHTCARAHTHT